MSTRDVRHSSPRHAERRLQRWRASGTLVCTLCLSGLASLGTAACDNPETLFPTGGNGGEGGSGASTSNGGNGGSGGAEPQAIVPAAGGARRLIARQYVGSIRTLLGDAAAAAATPPADPQLLGLESIAARDLATPPNYVELYETSARNIANVVVSDPASYAKLVPCTPAGVADAACLRQVAEGFAPTAWRRPLTEVELQRLTAVGTTAATGFNQFEAGVKNVLSAVLQSPNFLYIIEIGEPDAEDPTVRRLTPTELVTRMSFFLINSTPPAALLQAAAEGGLDTDEEIRALADQLVAQPEAQAALDAFYDEVYLLRNLATTPKDAVLFPEFTPTARAAMREETLRLVRDVVWDRDADAREILDADYTFVNGELAAIYGIPGVTGDAFVKVTPPAEQQRRGFLGHGSFLARAAHAESSSPTRRGAFVQDTLLCNPVPPPPPDVNPTFPPELEGLTAKEKLVQHMEDPSCKSCHQGMDPIGFALEPFDAIGRFRTTDQGQPIDPSGEVPDLGVFEGPGDLATLVHDDPRSATCMVKKLFRHSMGHLETKGERPAVIALGDGFIADGHSLQSLLADLCVSPAFRFVTDPK